MEFLIFRRKKSSIVILVLIPIYLQLFLKIKVRYGNRNVILSKIINRLVINLIIQKFLIKPNSQVPGGERSGYQATEHQWRHLSDQLGAVGAVVLVSGAQGSGH